MDVPQETICFVGDLSDPWVVAIAQALPAHHTTYRVDCALDLPEERPAQGLAPRLIVVHRNRLSPADAEKLRAWRAPGAAGPAPVLFLCVSPYVRYEDLERQSGVADVVFSEATAADVIARHAAQVCEGRAAQAPPARRPLVFRVEIASGNRELSAVLGEACATAGYRVELVGDVIMNETARPRARAGAARERVLSIWDVPVLEPDWPDRLGRYALAMGPVIALLGFATRSSVSDAKAHGAAACLELPCNLEDLLEAIDRTACSRGPESWPLPPRVELPHVLPRAPRRLRAAQAAAVTAPPWPDRDRPPTIS